jgi:hypothetical protein
MCPQGSTPDAPFALVARATLIAAHAAHSGAMTRCRNHHGAIFCFKADTQIRTVVPRSAETNRNATSLRPYTFVASCRLYHCETQPGSHRRAPNGLTTRLGPRHGSPLILQMAG